MPRGCRTRVDAAALPLGPFTAVIPGRANRTQTPARNLPNLEGKPLWMSTIKIQGVGAGLDRALPVGYSKREFAQDLVHTRSLVQLSCRISRNSISRESKAVTRKDPVSLKIRSGVEQAEESHDRQSLRSKPIQ